jgi:exo-beta-1,3-glucanase (GH17 family)
MLGAGLHAEVSNPKCPWGAQYADEALAKNRAHNDAEIGRALALCREYRGIVAAVSAGNEAVVEWTDHLVPVERVIGMVARLKKDAGCPVTFCENHAAWLQQPALADAVDLISLHSYPLWEGRPVEEAIAVTDRDYAGVTEKYPGKPAIITEAGWATRANGRGMPRERANEEFQNRYLTDLLAWGKKREVTVFVFEAVDENWKGSDDPDEPEKHWGLYTADRKPKLFAGGAGKA